MNTLKGTLPQEETSTAMVFDIQRFSLHDGPGVRTTVFFKGCPLRCLWCQNPESWKRPAEMAFYEQRCERCFACEPACPKDAIVRDAKHRIDFSRCDACGDCAAACMNEALRTIGKPWLLTTLFEEIVRDKDFFLDSGGGVTLSGGEPFLYPDFTLSLCAMLRQAGIHTLAETCGWFDSRLCELIAGSLDAVFFDIKHASASAHKTLTGKDNGLIIKNFMALCELMKDIQPRMPIVPGCNDDEENIRATATILRKAGKQSIHCLPYHSLGNDKLMRIQSSQAPAAIQPPTPTELERVKTIFKEEGIHAVLYS